MYALASEHAAHAVPVGEPGIVDTLLWGVLPYVTILVLIGGTIWRYRTDQFSWTTRSSQIYESKMLRLGIASVPLRSSRRVYGTRGRSSGA